MADFSNVWDIKEEGIEEDINGYKWTIFGRAKSGKTTLATKMFDDPVIGQFERGARAVSSKKIFFENWLAFRQFIKELKKGVKDGKKIPFKTFVMDTADVAWKMAEKYICTQEGEEQIGDIAYGKGFSMLSAEFLDQINELENLGVSMVFISHDVDKEFKPKVGDAFNITQMSVPERCMAVIRDMPDFILFLSNDKSMGEDKKIRVTRRAYFRSDGDIACGSRLKFMPAFIEFEDEAQLAVEIKKAFKRAVELEKSKNAEDIEKFMSENNSQRRILEAVINEKEVVPTVDEEELVMAKAALADLASIILDRKIMNKIAFKNQMKNALGVKEIDEATDPVEIYEFIAELKDREGLQ